MTKTARFVCLALSLHVPASAAGGAASEDSARSVMGTDLITSHGTKVSVYPYAYYNPEVKLAFGAGGIITFYTDDDLVLRPSKISLSGYYSTSKQYKLSLAPEMYFGGNRLFVSGKLFFGDQTYYTPSESNPEVEATAYGVAAELRLGKSSLPVDPLDIIDLKQLAMIFDYQHVELEDNEAGAADLPPHTLGLGLGRIWDSRDNIFYPTVGGLLRVEAVFYSKSLGSSFDFNHYLTDLRWYFGLDVESKQVLALQAYGELAAGSPPFYSVPALGGSNLMRGYKSGLLRDRYYLAGQAEFRTHLWWRIGAVGFVGAGNVAHRTEDMRIRDFRPSYGGGLRFVFNEQESINLRADFGFGEDTDGIYFGIEEAF